MTKLGIPPRKEEALTPAEARARYGHAKPAEAHLALRARQAARVFDDGKAPGEPGAGAAAAPAPSGHSSSRSRPARDVSGSVSSVRPRAVRWEIAASRRVRAGAGRAR